MSVLVFSSELFSNIYVTRFVFPRSNDKQSKTIYIYINLYCCDSLNFLDSIISLSHFIQEMSSPAYCIQPLKVWGLIAIDSGSGSVKTDIGNGVQLKWIHWNPSTNPNY